MLFDAASYQTMALTCSQQPIMLQTGLKVQPAKSPAASSDQKQVVMNAGDEYHNEADTEPSFPAQPSKLLTVCSSGAFSITDGFSVSNRPQWVSSL